jgi:chromosome segregation ATPase
MNHEKHDGSDLTIQEATPNWMSIAVVILTLVSLGALAVGWSASNRSRALEQKLSTLSTEVQQAKQGDEVLSQRFAKAEEIDEQLQGKLSVITDRMKLTHVELNRARFQATQIKEDNDRLLSDLQKTVSGQLATKASADDVNKLGTDVAGVKSNLDTTTNNLALARGEFGTLIAKNHDEIDELRRLGDRNYYEFTVGRKNQRERVGDLMVELKSASPKKNLYTVSLYMDDARYDKKNRSVNEPIYFFIRGTRAPMEFTVNQIGKDKIAGYLSVPKTNPVHAQISP